MEKKFYILTTTAVAETPDRNLKRSVPETLWLNKRSSSGMKEPIHTIRIRTIQFEQMKVLLVYPYFLEERIHKEDIEAVPMGLYCIGAVLKEGGYDVEILNWHDIHRTPEKIEETLIAKKPDVVGFSIVHANRWGGIEIARAAKRANRNVKIVFGGVGASFLWEHLLTRFQEIDFCVTGEAEFSFLELLRWFEDGNRGGPESIPGVACRKDGKVSCSPCADLIENLDDLPDPSRYFVYQHVSLSRGCPGNCTFCGSPGFWRRRVRFHSAEYFVNQLERLHRKGVNFFFVSDDTFALKKRLVVEICRKIIERNLYFSWAAICRVNDVDEEVLRWMRMAGCTQISYGIESGSEKIRRLLNKSLKTDAIKKAFALTASYGILPRAYFIYGCPGETWDTVGETQALIEEIKPLAAIFYILDLFPGTSLYEDYKRRTGIGDDIWLEKVEDILYFETDPALTADQVMAFGNKLRSGFHASLPRFADAIRLIDDKELYPFHADFLSRLAMTFSHGDYAWLEEIDNPDETAKKLNMRALLYYPDHRAFLGLGIIYQKSGHYAESIGILEKGLQFYPLSEHLNVCCGVSLVNAKEYERALACFEKFPGSDRARSFAVSCRDALRKK